MLEVEKQMAEKTKDRAMEYMTALQQVNMQLIHIIHAPPGTAHFAPAVWWAGSNQHQVGARGALGRECDQAYRCCTR